MMRIYFVTSNPVKLLIAIEVLNKYNIQATQFKLNLKELQTLDVKEVALDKAKQAMEIIKQPFIVSDDGFYINALGGFPGALLKHIKAKISDEKLIKLLKGEKDRTAEFVNVIVFGDPKLKSFKIFTTVTKGHITKAPKGNRKIGWSIEKIFIPEDQNKTTAQLTEKEWIIYWKKYKENLHYNKLGLWLKKSKTI